MLMMSWIPSNCKGYKLGAYLNDISGTFDRVFKPYLLGKLCEAGVGEKYLNFLISYLDTRSAQIAVGGALSDPIDISNTVFQGTVLGPPLWNLFFANVAVAAKSTG